MGGAILEYEARLFELAQAANDEELGDWVSAHLELDAAIERDALVDGPPVLVLRIGERGFAVDDFPITLATFWEDVNELEDEVIELWESRPDDEDRDG